MGIFSKITKTVKGIAKNPTNLRNYADLGVQSLTAGQVDTQGINKAGWVGGKDVNFNDILLGKKSKDINPDEIANQIRDTQSRGIGELNAALDTPSADIVREQVTRQKTGILSSAQDARRNAQKLIAQRGLGGSSIGLGLNRSIDQQAGKDIATVDAQMPGQVRDQQIRDSITRIGVGNVNQSGMNFNTIEGQRSGGVMGIAAALAPLAGSAAGAYKDYQTGALASRR